MTCEELLKALNDYVDSYVEGEQLTELCEEFAGHLAQCNPCQVVVDNIRQTISLYRSGQPFPLPERFQRGLEQTLAAHWQQKFGTLER